jgi:hypothetical protein
MKAMLSSLVRQLPWRRKRCGDDQSGGSNRTTPPNRRSSLRENSRSSISGMSAKPPILSKTELRRHSFVCRARGLSQEIRWAIPRRCNSKACPFVKSPRLGETPYGSPAVSRERRSSTHSRRDFRERRNATHARFFRTIPERTLLHILDLF